MPEEVLSQVSADQSEKHNRQLFFTSEGGGVDQADVSLERNFLYLMESRVTVDMQLVNKVFITTVHSNIGYHPTSANHL